MKMFPYGAAHLRPINKKTADTMGWREKDHELRTKVLPKKKAITPKINISTLTNCPICEVKINLKNLDNHLIKVHPCSSLAVEKILAKELAKQQKLEKIAEKLEKNAEKDRNKILLAERKKEKEIKKKQQAQQLEQKIKEKEEKRNSFLAQSKDEIPKDLIDQKINVSKTTGFVEKSGKLISVTKLKVKKYTKG
jgi:hypothetical protein